MYRYKMVSLLHPGWPVPHDTRSCLRHSSGIAGVQCKAWLLWFWESNQGSVHADKRSDNWAIAPAQVLLLFTVAELWVTSEFALPCSCQTFKGAISLVLSTRCFRNSFNCPSKVGYNSLTETELVIFIVFSPRRLSKNINFIFVTAPSQTWENSFR